MRAKTGFFAVILALFSLPTFAVETCHLDGKIILTQDTAFHCFNQDTALTFGPNLHIYTNGYQLHFYAEKNIALNGLKIDVVESPSVDVLNGKDAGLIDMQAESISGACGYIHNNGYQNGAGGAVSFHALTFHSKENGAFHCSDVTAKGVGQGMDGDITVIANSDKIQFSELLQRAIQ